MKARAAGRDRSAGFAKNRVLHASWLDEHQRLIWSVGLGTEDGQTTCEGSAV